MADSLTIERLKKILVDVLKLDLQPDQVDSERNLFQQEFGLNSIDVLQILVHVEREFDVEIEDGYIRMLPHLTLLNFADYIEQLKTQA